MVDSRGGVGWLCAGKWAVRLWLNRLDPKPSTPKRKHPIPYKTRPQRHINAQTLKPQVTLPHQFLFSVDRHVSRLRALHTHAHHYPQETFASSQTSSLRPPTSKFDNVFITYYNTKHHFLSHSQAGNEPRVACAMS